MPLEASRGRELLVPASAPWTATGLQVRRGQALELWATGQIQVARWSWFGRGAPYEVSPRGTFRYPDRELRRRFPLPAAAAGPAPCYALIGRVGADGAPFLVGEHARLDAPASGELFLGVNDFDPSDNSGSFRAAVARAGNPRPARIGQPLDWRPVIRGTGAPRPVRDSRVLVIYIDALRHDALKELAFAGYLPNIRRIFFDGGVDVEQTFTISPSNTVPATTAFLTGCWPDKSGLRTQLNFDRSAGALTYLLHPFGPPEAARRVRSPWWGLRKRTDDGPLLLPDHVAAAGGRFSATVLPVLWEFPPDLYLQRLANVTPLFGSHLIKDYYIDRIQTAFATEQVISDEHKVMMVWYSGVDSAGHRSARGLWGAARRELVRLDDAIGKLQQALERQGIADRTYLVLYADHGTSGGKTFVNQSYDLANDFFYASLRDDDGDRRADRTAGLGFNVHFQVRDVPVFRRHSDSRPEDYVSCAVQAYSMAWVSLPRARAGSRDWSRPNSWFELSRYEVDPALLPVDVPRRLLDVRRYAQNIYKGRVSDHPVGLVLVPLSGHQVLVLGQRGSQALIERRPLGEGARRFTYRYRVIRSLFRAAGGIEVEPLLHPTHDPLEYLAEPAIQARLAADPRWLERWRDDREWLEATAATQRPDAVVAFAHHLLDDPLRPRYDPDHAFDMLVVASRGWNFRADSQPSVDHGSPYRGSMQIPFLVSGPGLPRGARVVRPARIIDILPTVLELAGVPYDPQAMDGVPLRELWAAPDRVRRPAEGAPIAFHTDRGLALPAPDGRTKHGALVHDYDLWYDPHNLVANVGGLTSQEVLGLADQLVDLLLPGDPKRPIGATLDAFGAAYDRLPGGKPMKRAAQLLAALRLRNITLGELLNPIQSLQHVDRVALTVDWLQAVLKDARGDLTIAGVDPLLPLDLLLDHLMGGMLEVRRLLTELLARAVDLAVQGLESAIRWGADGTNGRVWETPRFVRRE